jgi:hypothetical protein
MSAVDTWNEMHSGTWYEEYAKSVDMDGAFAAWLKLTDDVLDRWLNLEYSEFDNHCDPRMHYIEGMTPISFTKNILIPVLQYDLGCDFVEDMIAERILRGSGR